MKNIRLAFLGLLHSVGRCHAAAAEQSAAPITGAAGNENLHGTSAGDVFDSSAGGDDTLYGYGGDDVYTLGAGTGADVIKEHYGNAGDENDVIKIKDGYAEDDVRLRRSNDGDDLLVELLNSDGKVTDSLTVENYYTDPSARIERVEFTDGTVWDAEDFAAARITGGKNSDQLHGEKDLNDVFDSVGGNDRLHGYSGDDVYMLGAGTGRDTIAEYHGNSGGDANDVIKIKDGYTAADARLRRSYNGDDLLVELLNAKGAVTDSLTVQDYYVKDAAKVERVEFADGTVWEAEDFAAARITGGERNENLYGENNLADVFDSSGGGDDRLYGRTGDDVYWLGAGTKHDTVIEGDSGDANDVIKIKDGYATGNARLRRSDDGDDLLVELLNAKDEVTDSLTVQDYYTKDAAKVERVEFADGTVWSAEDFAAARITGGKDSDRLHGERGLSDVFDGSGGGNDRLYGYSGDDVYWLGAGAGHDDIYEYSRNSGDANDMIKIKSGYAADDVRLRRSNDGRDLHVELLDAKGAATDSLIVKGYYVYASGEVESVVFNDGAVWDLKTLAAAEILGSGAGDNLAGRQQINDTLLGYGGNDVYWLGAGAGHDVIREHVGNSGDSGDMIKIKSGIGADDVRLQRSEDGSDLLIQLLDAAGGVTDSLTVEAYYTDAAAKVESLVFADGTIWNAAALTAAGEISGTAGADTLPGKSGSNDTLQGGAGNDVYSLGAGIGHDVIREHKDNSGDAGDKIMVAAGIAAGNVRLMRSRDGEDLLVQRLDAGGAVTDSLTVEKHFTDASAAVESIVFTDGNVTWDSSVLALAEITGSAADDSSLKGKDNQTDVFDADAGGDDVLYGGSGNDIYWLGAGTGNDIIAEYQEDSSLGDAGDMIRVKNGIAPADARLRRSDDGEDLLVELLDASGAVTDSLTVQDYYAAASAKVESVQFADGTVWDAADFAPAPITGGAGIESLYGRNGMSDVFDSAAGGNDRLYGGTGDDVYWLGAGTGFDVIYELFSDDDNDRIRLKSGYAPADVRLMRSDDGDDLLVQLLDDRGEVTAQLLVDNHYGRDDSKIEGVEFAGGAVWSGSALAPAEVKGTAGADSLEGAQNTHDILYGGGGNDIYLLGAGAGHDVIKEHADNSGDANDTVKLKSGIAAADVRLRRSDNGDHLQIELLDAAGGVTDSLTVEYYYTDDSAKIERVEFSSDSATVWTADDFAAAEIIGGAGDDELHSASRSSGNIFLRNTSDVFDADAGGNDTLYGYGGGDVYLLGAGTGHDVIMEHYFNGDDDADDLIRLKNGYAAADVRLMRSADGEDLHVQLLDAAGGVTDSLTVDSYYTHSDAQVEKLEFADGTTWTLNDLAAAAMLGSAGADELAGRDNKNDILYGYGGNDVYLLGAGSGADVIREYTGNSGDAGDIIRLKSGVAPADVRLRRSADGDDLLVVLLDENGAVTDSLTAENHFVDASAKIEGVEFSDSDTIWGAQELAAARITGGAGNESLRGKSDLSDVFDADGGGNDYLYGYSGDDVYWLGKGAGLDVIRENFGNISGDADDKIKIKAGIAPADVRLRRSNDGDDLYVELLNENGAVTDSLQVQNYYADSAAKVESVEFSGSGEVWDVNVLDAAEIIGGAGDDLLHGKADFSDVFDSDGGGSDRLYGYSGDDIYWLGAGTGADTIWEYDAAGGDADDKIKIKSGYTPANTRLLRSDDGNSLLVQLLDENGAVTDSLTVLLYYTDPSAKVESVEFADSDVIWDADDFALARIRGDAKSNWLYGEKNLDDVFDGDAGGNDRLLGYSGDDVYWLGAGTDHDVIKEYYDNSDGDIGDVIRLKSGIGAGDVRLLRSDNGEDLLVQLLDNNGAVTDSLTVEDYYTDPAARVESLEFSDDAGTVWDAALLTAAAEIKGTAGADTLSGKSGSNDTLLGYGGDDVYSLAAGGGHDVIREHKDNSGDADDKIKIGAGIGIGNVRLLRSGDEEDLIVQLLNAAGEVTDSLTVEKHFTDASAKIESIEFSDGTTWNAAILSLTEITGTAGNDNPLTGNKDRGDVFDADAGGNDTLHGFSGNDIYWLGAGTGKDVIREYYDNSGGDAGDMIRIKSAYAPADARLRRSDDGNDLIIELATGKAAAADSLTVEDYYTKDAAKVERVEFSDGTAWGAADFALAQITGGAGKDNLFGERGLDDVFDSDFGGDDRLYGYSGNDVYWLGAGTGRDTIVENFRNAAGDADDRIKIKSGYGAGNARLRRSDEGNHLLVELLNAADAVTDSLTVQNYYTSDAAKVESVEFADGGAAWGAADFALARITGGANNDTLRGKSDMSDVFDSDFGGNDSLYGYSGNDVYWLGAGTGKDVIKEYYGNAAGDADDKIKIKSGIAAADVRLRRSDDGYDLLVDLLNAAGAVTDSLQVEEYYQSAAAQIESVEFADGTVWNLSNRAAKEALGDSGDNTLAGNRNVNDILQGGKGSDTYTLGAGSGHDVIDERIGNDSDGDSGDKIKLESGTAVTDVRLRRSEDGADLIVELLDADGAVTDSLTVQNHFTDAAAKVESIEFADADSTKWNADAITAAAVIKGGADNDTLAGESDIDNVFDADAGGNDTLQGKSGNDTYWLGAGTGKDTIQEHAGNDKDGDAGDKIKIKSGYGADDVRLLRSRDGEDLLVQLLDAYGMVTDSLIVEKHFTDPAAKVESVEFADGTVWGADVLALTEITGAEGNESLYGKDNQTDVFDSDAGGDDTLWGHSGNDVYWLGAGTGHDRILESYSSSSSERSGEAGGDMIRIKSGYKPNDVRIRRDGNNNLVVDLLDDNGAVSDSLTVGDYYYHSSALIGSIELADGTVWTAKDFEQLEITGGAGDDLLDGSGFDDIFDSDAGGNDTLYGDGGNDVYMLGAGTDHDVIDEGQYERNSSADDKIKIKSGYALADVRLSRSVPDQRGNQHLVVQLLNAKGEVTDSLTVLWHFTNAFQKIESIEAAGHVLFEDQYQGLIDELAAFKSEPEESSFSSEAAIRAHYWTEKIKGTSGKDTLEGGKQNARDVLVGAGGDDVYLLGAGTGHDVIREYEDQSGNIRVSGDAGDKIEIKSGYKPADARLRRSREDLYVDLLSDDGVVSDSLTVKRYYTDASARIESVEFADGTVWTAKDFAAVEITGGAGDDFLTGSGNFDDVFDADAGGNDTLLGYAGNDVYWLGAGTDHDVIWDSGGADDKIKIKNGYAPADVRLSRSGNGLIVQLLADDGTVSDSLTVVYYYYWRSASARVESVEFADGTVWNSVVLTAAGEIRGTAGADTLSGKQNSHDTLVGYGGDDVYSLGKDSGHDVIREHTGNSGDDGDKIEIVGSDYGADDVRLLRSGNDLLVQLLDVKGEVTDSLTVENHYTDASAKVESIEAAGHVLRENQFQGLIDEIAAFTAKTSTFASLDAIYDHYWEDTTLTSSNG